MFIKVLRLYPILQLFGSLPNDFTGAFVLHELKSLSKLPIQCNFYAIYIQCARFPILSKFKCVLPSSLPPTLSQMRKTYNIITTKCTADYSKLILAYQCPYSTQAFISEGHPGYMLEYCIVINKLQWVQKYILCFEC